MGINNINNNINIGSVISPDVLKTISSASAIKTFGDQLTNKAKEKVVAVMKNKVGDLEDQLQKIVIEEIKAGSDYNTELKRLEIIYKNKQITQDQYNEAVSKENIAYQVKQKTFEAQKIKIKKDIQNIILDPFKKIKEAKTKRKAKVKAKKIKNKLAQAKARRDLIFEVVKNTAKTLAPIIALQLANKFTSILSQRSKLEELVDQVNTYIVQANTFQTITIATNLRNNTITLINNSINKLQKVQQIIVQINFYITIFSLILSILSAIPLPTAVPPGVGVPISLIAKIIKTIEKANKLISALSVILAIATVILENEILKLNDLIERLKAVNVLLNGKTNLNLNEQQLADLSNTFLPLGNEEFPSYKGFKFKIKEEQNPLFVVKGNKRRYAVAIDRDGVEVLKSDYSFTLDPNDLVEQLKLVIDQKNLQG
jgi:hypothetical protein